MISTRHDGGPVRQVLIGMITDTVVAARIASQWQQDGQFGSKWADLVGWWCVDHVRKYNAAPNGRLSGIYERWAETHDKEVEVVKAIESLLSSLSEQHAKDETPPSSEYYLDLAKTLFSKTRVKNAMDLAEAAIDRNQVDDAMGFLGGLSKVELGVGACSNPSEDYDEWVASFDLLRDRPLIAYPGDIGRFLRNAFCRGEFYAIQAPDKSGKSFWLLDLAYQAIKNRNRVLFVDAGDMTKKDIYRRLGVRAARVPLEAGEILVPNSINEAGTVSQSPRFFQTGLDAATGYKAFKRACQDQLMFKLYCYPNGSLNVQGIDGLIADVVREGWVPDVCIVDYADILAPPQGVRDRLDQIDATWMQLRRISQERHCLLVTATQSSAEAYRMAPGGVQGKRHFSGRKTKNAHVNGILAINVNEEERSVGACRVNWTVRRNAQYSESAFCRVAGCLDIASPAIRSYYR